MSFSGCALCDACRDGCASGARRVCQVTPQHGCSAGGHEFSPMWASAVFSSALQSNAQALKGPCRHPRCNASCKCGQEGDLELHVREHSFMACSWCEPQPNPFCYHLCWVLIVAASPAGSPLWLLLPSETLHAATLRNYIPKALFHW